LIKIKVSQTNSPLEIMMEKRSIEVCFSPALAEFVQTRGDSIVVVVDILRATTSMIAALANGARSVIPVATVEKATELGKNGFPIAAERDGQKLSFATYGNSAFEFMKGEVVGEKLVFSTTNGTVAIETAKNLGQVCLGAFSNLSALSRWIVSQDENVVVLCSGWKNSFCLEDTLFAGALIEKLLTISDFDIQCDSAEAARDLWSLAKNNPAAYADKAIHRERLRKLGVDEVVEYSYKIDTATVVPVLFEGSFTDISQKE